MKARSALRWCKLRNAEDIRVGDTVCFEQESANYVVTEVQPTEIGMLRHQHKHGSSSYWPNELLYVLEA